MEGLAAIILVVSAIAAIYYFRKEDKKRTGVKGSKGSGTNTHQR